MSILKAQKLKRLLDAWEPGTVATSVWLERHGVSPQDVQNYVKSQWLVSLGRGAFKRPSEVVGWAGAIHSLQEQLKLPVHVGGLTSIELAGQAHYARLGGSTVQLFAPPDVTLPRWFQTHWGQKARLFRTAVMPPDLGLTEGTISETFRLRTATMERAALEILYLAPRRFGLVEAAHIIDGLRTLRPKLMQQLLESCTSIKVRRLFLYLAERAGLPVLRNLALDRIDLGNGDRRLVSDGRYARKHRLVLPRELLEPPSN